MKTKETIINILNKYSNETVIHGTAQNCIKERDFNSIEEELSLFIENLLRKERRDAADRAKLRICDTEGNPVRVADKIFFGQYKDEELDYSVIIDRESIFNKF
jgi:hypothetical protein